MATVEKVNEEYEKPEDLIILLYDRSIRHFSLIITSTKNSDETTKIKLGNANNINIKELTKENIINYIKNDNIKSKNINIKKGDFIEDLNTTNFITKKGFN